MSTDEGSQSTLEQIYKRFVEKLSAHEAFGENLASQVASDLKQGKMTSLDSVNSILEAEEGANE